MNNFEIKNLQNFFLQTIYSNPEKNYTDLHSAKEYSYFNPETFHRIQAYRESFYARVSNVFSESIFNLASLLFGKSFIEKYLIDYFYQNPTPENMTESVRLFASYLETQEEISYCPFVPDFVKLCFLIQDILAAKNPSTTINPQVKPCAESIYLQPDHIIFDSNWPIFQLYNIAKEFEILQENLPGNKEISDELRAQKLSHVTNCSESVIIFKSQPWSLDIILIPKDFSKIMDLLSKGYSLQYSIENAEINEELFNLEKFSQWISLLTKQNAFISQNIS